jgi:hypothetical protein
MEMYASVSLLPEGREGPALCGVQNCMCSYIHVQTQVPTAIEDAWVQSLVEGDCCARV